MQTARTAGAMRAAAFLTIAVSTVFFFCQRNNPYDSKSINYVSGSRPHVAFVQKTLEGFLLDSLTIRIAWSDTAIGGGKGGIRKYYFDWNGDTLFRDSIDGTAADTFVIKKAFAQGDYTVRVKAEDFDGKYSDVDSMRLTVRSSLPQIISSSAPHAVEKAVVCTVSVTAGDSGGAIRSFLWASNGADFKDTTAAGSFMVSYADTGAKTILVKVRDNKSIESTIDTIHLSVFEKLYTVSYDGNGSTGGSVPLDNNAYGQGQSVEVLENMGALFKTGYTFVGWNTQANDSGAGYMPRANFTMVTSNVTLYAQWEVSLTYATTYNGNGNSGGTVPTDTAHYTLGQSVTTRGNTGALVKSGFTFVGWNTQANGSGIGYATGVAFTMGSADVTLYAQWTADPTYTVTYNGNTNTSGNVPADGNNYRSGDSVTVLGNIDTLVKTGYTFVGWNTQANGNGGTAYAAGVKFAMGSAGVTLYAQWSANPTYAVTYNGNASGYTGSVPTDANNYLTGAIVTVLNPGSLARAGYTFAGWNTQTSGGTGYAVGATFAMGSANVTLFAQWTFISTYTVTYNGNGNTGGTVPIPADTAHYTLGQSDTTRANNGLLVKTGFTFVGWNTAANGSGISYAAGVAFMMGSANVILYAQWSADPTYTVTYDGNGNTGGTVPTDSNNYLSGATVTVAQNTGNLAKAGFAFVGWNTRTNGKGTSYATGVTFAMASANAILYAQWSANPTYTVTYNGGSGFTGGVPTDANNYLTGAIVTVMNRGSLARAGYTFAGWNTQADGSGTTYAVGATFTIASSNVILYAKWIAIFTVGYDGNGSSGGSIPIDPNNYTTGSTVIVLGNNGLLVKTGYTFAGWSTLPGAGTSYAVGAIFTMGTSNITLYAKWTINQYTVTFNSEGGSAVASQSVNYGSTATAPASPTLTGYAFAGWYADAGYATAWNFSTNLVTGNVTIYAKWTINQYTVTFNSEGGSAVASQSVNYGSTATAPASPTLTGYAFAGWYADAGYATAWNFSTNLVTGNVTIYAKWTINQYTVTFNSEGGSAVASQSVNYGSMATAPPDPTLTGYTFAGWYADVGLTTAWNFSANLVTGDVTVYAKWTINQYTVTFNAQGGSAVPSQTVNYGSTVTAPADPTLSGYALVDWTTDQAGTTPWTFSTDVVATDMTLYAQWTPSP